MSNEAVQEQSGVKQDCLCIEHANDALRDAYPDFKVVDGISIRRTVVATYNVKGKKARGPILFATFCPFCGIKYED